LSFNNKTPVKANNEEMDKDQPNTNNQYKMVSNSFVPPNELKYVNSHPSKFIIGNPIEATKTRVSLRNINEHCSFVSHIELKSFLEAKNDVNWTLSMQDGLHQFKTNDVWELFPRPKNQSFIRTKWVYRNKVDEHGTIIKNKVKLVVKCYNQEEGVDYEETFA